MCNSKVFLFAQVKVMSRKRLLRVRPLLDVIHSNGGIISLFVLFDIHLRRISSCLKCYHFVNLKYLIVSLQWEIVLPVEQRFIEMLLLYLQRSFALLFTLK